MLFVAVPLSQCSKSGQGLFEAFELLPVAFEMVYCTSLTE
jgi:hypothetical protein